LLEGASKRDNQSAIRDKLDAVVEAPRAMWYRDEAEARIGEGSEGAVQSVTDAQDSGLAETCIWCSTGHPRAPDSGRGAGCMYVRTFSTEDLDLAWARA